MNDEQHKLIFIRQHFPLLAERVLNNFGVDVKEANRLLSCRAIYFDIEGNLCKNELIYAVEDFNTAVSNLIKQDLKWFRRKLIDEN